MALDHLDTKATIQREWDNFIARATQSEIELMKLNLTGRVNPLDIPYVGNEFALQAFEYEGKTQYLFKCLEYLILNDLLPEDSSVLVLDAEGALVDRIHDSNLDFHDKKLLIVPTNVLPNNGLLSDREMEACTYFANNYDVRYILADMNHFMSGVLLQPLFPNAKLIRTETLGQEEQDNEPH